MTPQELFDKLIEQKHITVSVTGTGAESLRVQLVTKFSSYKKLLDANGFLSDEMECQVLKTTRKEKSTTFQLATKKPRHDYQIIENDDAEISKDLANNPSSEVRRMDNSESPQVRTTAADPSCSQGEDTGSSSSKDG